MAQEFEPLDAASVALVACVSPWTRIHTAETFNDAVALPGRAAHLLASPAVETEWKGRDRLGSAGAIWKGHGFGWDEPTATTAFAWGAHASLAEPALRVACHRARPSEASGEVVAGGGAEGLGNPLRVPIAIEAIRGRSTSRRCRAWAGRPCRCRCGIPRGAADCSLTARNSPAPGRSDRA